MSEILDEIQIEETQAELTSEILDEGFGEPETAPLPPDPVKDEIDEGLFLKPEDKVLEDDYKWVTTRDNENALTLSPSEEGLDLVLPDGTKFSEVLREEDLEIYQNIVSGLLTEGRAVWQSVDSESGLSYVTIFTQQENGRVLSAIYEGTPQEKTELEENDKEVIQTKEELLPVNELSQEQTPEQNKTNLLDLLRDFRASEEENQEITQEEPEETSHKITEQDEEQITAQLEEYGIALVDPEQHNIEEIFQEAEIQQETGENSNHTSQVVENLKIEDNNIFEQPKDIKEVTANNESSIIQIDILEAEPDTRPLPTEVKSAIYTEINDTSKTTPEIIKEVGVSEAKVKQDLSKIVEHKIRESNKYESKPFFYIENTLLDESFVENEVQEPIQIEEAPVEQNTTQSIEEVREEAQPSPVNEEVVTVSPEQTVIQEPVVEQVITELPSLPEEVNEEITEAPVEQNTTQSIEEVREEAQPSPVNEEVVIVSPEQNTPQEQMIKELTAEVLPLPVELREESILEEDIESPQETLSYYSIEERIALLEKDMEQETDKGIKEQFQAIKHNLEMVKTLRELAKRDEAIPIFKVSNLPIVEEEQEEDGNTALERVVAGSR